MCTEMGQVHTSSYKALLHPTPKSDQTNLTEGFYQPNICQTINRQNVRPIYNIAV